MKREVGDCTFPIWLIGDSNPEQWQSSLKTPLDPRHPIRHNIWTSVLDVIQDRVYRVCKKRVDTSSVYIRNAVDDVQKRPKHNLVDWDKSSNKEVSDFKKIVDTFSPPIIFSFGGFAFEFTRRSLGEQAGRGHKFWSTHKLGDEFRRRFEKFNPNSTNVIPLLHRSISGGKFITSHERFCEEKDANYFDYVGCKIADIILAYKDELRIWIK